MTVQEIIALAQAAAQLYAIVSDNVDKAKETLGTEDITALQAILDPLHATNVALGQQLDAALAEAAKG